MRAGQVEQIVLLPKQDLVRVQFKDGKEAKVNIFPNDQEVLRTEEVSPGKVVVGDGLFAMIPAKQ